MSKHADNIKVIEEYAMTTNVNKLDKFDDYIKKQSPSRKYKLDSTKKNLEDLNETMTKIKSGELEANLGADSYENVNRIFLNRLLKEDRFNPEDYLDYSLDDIEKTLKSKNAFRKQNFQDNKKNITDYINNADLDSLTTKEVADLFDVGTDMVKSNFSSKPEYKFKFIKDKYHPEDGAKDFSFSKILKQNQEELGIQKINRAGTQDRSEYLLFDGLFRSTSATDVGLTSNATRQEVAEKFFEYMKKEKPNWRSEYRDELNNLAYLDQQKNIANRTIENMFNDYKTKYPKQFANENVGEYKLQVSHNFPLKRDSKFLKGAALDAARLSYNRTNNVHHAKIESQVLKIKNKVDETGKITEEQLKKLDELDKKAKKLGTLYFTDIGGEMKYIGEKKAPGINTLVNALEKHFVEISKRKGPGKNVKGETIKRDFQTKEIGVTGKFGDEFVPRPFNQGGEIRGYAEGDQVMAEENQKPRTTDQASMLSKIGNLFIPSAEAAPFKQVFKPIMDWMMVGDAPKTITNIQKSQQKALPAPKLPFKRETETRYNIISPEGQKVFQSPGLDDANQKALELGNQEGLTFRVEEVQVPVKVKKKKTGTQLAVTLTPDAAIGTGSNRVYYSRLVQNINSPTGNLIIKGQPVARDSIALSAKEWQDYFRSIGIRESELQDAYIRQYLNKKGGFNKETRQFTNNTPITYDEIADLVASSPSNSIQSAKYGDYAGNLKYGDSGRNDNYVAGTREERVLWIDSADIRGDIGGLPSDVARYEGHSSMRQVTDDVDFATKNKLGPNSEPYVIGWSLNSTRKGKSAAGANVFVSVADEIQSDFLQKAASVKARLKKDIRAYAERGDLEEVKNLQTRLDNVFRPLPATAFEINEQLTNLNKAKEVFDNVAKVEIDRVTPGMFQALKAAGKLRDESLREINRVIDNVDMNKMFPNIPFKDQKDWVDALIKNDVYEAAKKRFYFDENGAIQINRDAPSHYAVAPAKAVRAADPLRGIKLDPTDPNRSGQAVAYDMQYGGPKAVDHTGAHFTSNSEESLRRIARSKNSDVSIGTIDFGNKGSKVETYLLELTPDMLTPYATYFKDGGIVQKKKMFNPVLSINDILRPIGA